MNRTKLRNLILKECSCMAREAELPGHISAALPMLQVLGYGGDNMEGEVDYDEDHSDGNTDEIEITGDYDSDAGLEYEDSDDQEESSMVKNNLSNVASQAQKLHTAIGDSDDLPEWVQEKVAVATSMMDTVFDYLNAESGEDMNEARGRKPWYMKKRRNMKKTEENAWYDIPKKSSEKSSKKK
jgi:hypothetical protein